MDAKEFLELIGFEVYDNVKDNSEYIIDLPRTDEDGVRYTEEENIEKTGTPKEIFQQLASRFYHMGRQDYQYCYYKQIQELINPLQSDIERSVDRHEPLFPKQKKKKNPFKIERIKRLKEIERMENGTPKGLYIAKKGKESIYFDTIKQASVALDIPSNLIVYSLRANGDDKFIEGYKFYYNH